MAHLVAVGRALPGDPYPQQDITQAIGALLTDDPARLSALHRLHAATGVRTRHLALPLDRYGTLSSFGAANDVFIIEGTRLAEEACRAAMDSAEVSACELDVLVSTSVTGIAVPSIDVALVGALGMSNDVRRMPSFGLGCAGGAAGLAQLHDYLLGHPRHAGLLVSVELCSLTIQRGDDSTANLVASGLFGDGAAAVVMVGDQHPRAAELTGLEVVGSRSSLYPGTTDQLGWHISETGFSIMLAPGLPDAIAEHLGCDVDALLARYSLTRREVGTWVVHAGGPRVFDAVAAALDLHGAELELSRESLASVGNLSSSSVLHVLADTLDRDRPAPGGYAVLIAFGPGVSAELVLLRRPEQR
ncbi:type III polyketide synthase [Ruania halotolerans]|uniref:type III polyketide synthase n=1 Tax=Ruania halotolerans TaxID=2897773 RepID=UPI001E345E17|nr:3-oxoacyl-[acyl-carrier-protein] synthase III C-terminal domain-containing protein [Ruania halotolerans]UFU06983.1 type III polyketide synthase [Ruania halotolerans]